MALPLSYNVRNVRRALAGDPARDRRHRPGGRGLRRAPVDVRGLPARPALHRADRQRDHRAARLRLRADLGVPLDHRNHHRGGRRAWPAGADGQPLASWDWVIVVSLPKTTDGQPTQRHRSARSSPGPSRFGAASRSSRGACFTPGLDEVIVGRRLTDRIQGLRVGGTVKYQQKRLPDRRRLRLPGRRLRERDLGRLRHLGGRLPARGGLQLAGRAHEGPGRHPRRSTDGSGAQPQMQLQAVSRSGSTTRTRRARWPRSCRAWPASWPSSWAWAPCSAP